MGCKKRIKEKVINQKKQNHEIIAPSTPENNFLKPVEPRMRMRMNLYAIGMDRRIISNVEKYAKEVKYATTHRRKM